MSTIAEPPLAGNEFSGVPEITETVAGPLKSRLWKRWSCLGLSLAAGGTAAFAIMSQRPVYESCAIVNFSTGGEILESMSGKTHDLVGMQAKSEPFFQHFVSVAGNQEILGEFLAGAPVNYAAFTESFVVATDNAVPHLKFVVESKDASTHPDYTNALANSFTQFHQKETEAIAAKKQGFLKAKIHELDEVISVKDDEFRAIESKLGAAGPELDGSLRDWKVKKQEAELTLRSYAETKRRIELAEGDEDQLISIPKVALLVSRSGGGGVDEAMSQFQQDVEKAAAKLEGISERIDSLEQAKVLQANARPLSEKLTSLNGMRAELVSQDIALTEGRQEIRDAHYVSLSAVAPFQPKWPTRSVALFAGLGAFLLAFLLIPLLRKMAAGSDELILNSASAFNSLKAESPLNNSVFDELDKKSPNARSVKKLAEIPWLGGNDLGELLEGALSQETYHGRAISELSDEIVSNSLNSGILVTGKGRGTGKTFFSITLASSLTARGKRVLLVEGNEIHPSLHLHFAGKTGQAPSYPVSTVEAAIDFIRVASSSLHVLTKEHWESNSLLCGEILENAERLFDVIVFDGPGVEVSESWVFGETAITDAVIVSRDGALGCDFADRDILSGKVLLGEVINQPINPQDASGNLSFNSRRVSAAINAPVGQPKLLSEFG